MARSITTIKYNLSEELAAIIGKTVATRPEVTKLLWKYIKAENLQDEVKKRIIHVEDDPLMIDVFGNKPIDMMKLAGKLKPHFDSEA